MKFSRSLIPTLRDAPNDAEVISHKLLVRAGFIRKVTAGIYEYLPLGLKSLNRVANIVRDELNKAGCQEVFLPHLIPAELWQESGRWPKYGKELLRIKDRHEREYCFGPTHEEVICDLVRSVVNTYKQLPLNLYQIQTKFRDETRPRFGLMRGREFLMKDGYSFHTSVEDLDREYKVMHQAYLNIFARCGLKCRAVDADTGAIGGKSSHEFMVLAETGEDVVAHCDACVYAANLEKAVTFYEPVLGGENVPPKKEVHTPKMKSIDEVSKYLGTKPSQMIKTLVYIADKVPAIVCLSGDRDVNEVKLKHVTGATEVRLASEAEILELTGVPVGFLGPVGLSEMIQVRNALSEFAIYFDQSVMLCVDGVTGANKADFHLQHVSLDRDLDIGGFESTMNLCDFSSVKAGDLCPTCKKGRLNLVRGIEVGHIFKLGTRYSEPMKVSVLDQGGKNLIVTMGTYGIGIGRAMASSVEQNHDEHGIVWPRAIAPFDVHLVTMDNSEDILAKAEEIKAALEKTGVEVLWDDRDERAGVKFNDADLIGLPLHLILGKRGLAKGVVEYKIRRTGVKGEIGLGEVNEKVTALLAEC